jgi:hypothetical protein
MSITLNLPPEIEEALTEVAEADGQVVADYAVHILISHLAPVATLLQRQGRRARAQSPVGNTFIPTLKGAAVVALAPELAEGETHFLTDAGVASSSNYEHLVPFVAESGHKRTTVRFSDLWVDLNAPSPNLFYVRGKAPDESLLGPYNESIEEANTSLNAVLNSFGRNSETDLQPASTEHLGREAFYEDED